jgi:Tol biopolymer transport system component
MAVFVDRASGGLNSPGTLDSGSLLISSTRDDGSPQYSPDGTRIAFVSDRSGNDEIWVCGSDGSNSEQITSFAGPDVTTPRWSPDGERIAFDSNAAGEYDIWVVGVNGGKPVRVTTHPANDGNPSWSRDGRWIYFDSRRTERQQVFKIPANGGEATQVTQDGGFAPLESPDGKFLYYTKALEGTSVWRVPLDGGQPIKVLEGLSSYINLAIVASGMYFVPVRNLEHNRLTDKGDSIKFLDFRTGQIRLVANVAKPFNFNAGTGGLAISPDGRWILYQQFDQAGSELMFVKDFR